MYKPISRFFEETITFLFRASGLPLLFRPCRATLLMHDWPFLISRNIRYWFRPRTTPSNFHHASHQYEMQLEPRAHYYLPFYVQTSISSYKLTDGLIQEGFHSGDQIWYWPCTRLSLWGRQLEFGNFSEMSYDWQIFKFSTTTFRLTTRQLLTSHHRLAHCLWILFRNKGAIELLTLAYTPVWALPRKAVESQTDHRSLESRAASNGLLV